MNQSLTQANFMSAVRYIMTWGISFAAGRGWITTDAAANIGILGIALLPMIWGWYQNYLNKQTSEGNLVIGVRAGVAMAVDPSVHTPSPLAIGPLEAKSVAATYAPT